MHRMKDIKKVQASKSEVMYKKECHMVHSHSSLAALANFFADSFAFALLMSCDLRMKIQSHNEKVYVVAIPYSNLDSPWLT